MGPRSSSVLKLAGLSAALLLSAGAGAAARFEPAGGKVLLVIGQDVDNIDAYLRSVGSKPGGFAAYTSVEGAEGLYEAADNGGGVQHAQRLVDEHPNAAIQLALYMVDACSKVTAGDLDENLDRIADWISGARRPVYFRIGYEFDLPENHYHPAEYVAAYQYIVDRFRRRGVRNVAYVWHSYAADAMLDHMEWYPGDKYVDWVAVSYFRQHPKHLNAIADIAKRRGKPLMVAEASPWHLSTSTDDRAWNAWFVHFFKWIRDKDVKVISYINCDWDRIPLFESMGWGDTRVQSNRTIREKWIREISDERYLKSHPGLFRELGETGR